GRVQTLERVDQAGDAAADVAFGEKGLLDRDVVEDVEGDEIGDACGRERAVEQLEELLGAGKLGGDVGLEQVAQAAALVGELDVDHLGLAKRLEIGGAVWLVAERRDLLADAGAGDSLEEEVVLAVGELLVGEDLADADDGVDGWAAVVVLLPAGLEQSHGDAAS